MYRYDNYTDSFIRIDGEPNTGTTTVRISRPQDRADGKRGRVNMIFKIGIVVSLIGAVVLLIGVFLSWLGIMLM